MERHFDPAAVVLKAVLFNHQGRVLIIRRSGCGGSEFWDLPGGRVREGEDFEASARREIEEETGIRPSCLKLFKSEPAAFPDGKPVVARVYTAFARIDPKLGTGHSGFEWANPKNPGERNWLFSQMPQWIAGAPRPQTRSVMCILENNGEILLLKRSMKVSGWSGWYYGVGGSVEDGEEPLDAAYREIREELGLAAGGIELVLAGEPFKLTENHTIFPFRLRSKRRDVKLDWEHDEAVWVRPEHVSRYNCVPFFVRSARALGFDVEAKAKIVNCAVVNGGMLLLLKRGPDVATHRGTWGIVAGYIEPGESPEQAAFKEITEETGLRPSQFRLLKTGMTKSSSSEGITWEMHPFLFESLTDKITLDWEHEEHCWVRPEEIKNYNTTPGMADVLRSVGIL